MRNFKVVPVPKSKILNLSFRYSDPQMAKKILDTFLDLYISYHGEVYAVPGALQFFSDVGGSYKKEWEKAEADVAEFKNKWGLSAPDKQKGELITLNKQIEDSLVEINANLTQYQDMVTALDQGTLPTGQLSASMQRGTENTVISVIATQLLRAMQKQMQLAEYFTPGSRDLRAAEEVVTDLSNKFRGALVSESDILRAKKASLEASLKAKREALAALEEKSEEARKLQLAATVAKERYLQYLAKEEEARLEKLRGGSRVVTVSVIGKPFVQPDPIFPKTGLFVLAAFFVSFPLGIGIILLANFFDHTFDNPRDVEFATGYPVLASLGKMTKADSVAT
jgi:uncharacterized protein involved in exopolysaccharide biosynthesis